MINDVIFVGCVYIELNGLVLPAPDTVDIKDDEIEIWYANESLRLILEQTKTINSLLISLVSSQNKTHNLIYRKVDCVYKHGRLFVIPNKASIVDVESDYVES